MKSLTEQGIEAEPRFVHAMAEQALKSQNGGRMVTKATDPEDDGVSRSNSGQINCLNSVKGEILNTERSWRIDGYYHKT